MERSGKAERLRIMLCQIFTYLSAAFKDKQKMT